MEFVIGLGIGAVIALITGKRKKHREQQLSETSFETEPQRRQNTEEEIIAVILPTINNDK